MHLIVGHTTHDSTWIWVRGNRKLRELRVVLEFSDGVAVASRAVEVHAETDYTGVARFDAILTPSTPYKIVVSSKKASQVLEGRLRTFPKPGSTSTFDFLHGSCNLPSSRLTALGSMSLGLLGGIATRNALHGPARDWDAGKLPGSLRWIAWPVIRGWVRHVFRVMSRGIAFIVRRLTRYEQPRPLFPSPFETLVESIDVQRESQKPAFMVHCGDQIYFDVDYPEREGTKEDYRRNYRQAWFEDPSTERLLASLPHYMVLDDHDVIDNFGTDPDSREHELRGPALEAYVEYVSSRQPSERYYNFEYGDTGFFVLDTRTERCPLREQMVDDEQLREFASWLAGTPPHRRHSIKFVVTSVPFVAQLRPSGLEPGGGRRDDDREDKWSGLAWRRQRDEILALLHDSCPDPVVFLAGDLHCTYHARLQLGAPRRRVTVHELGGGPMSQLYLAHRGDLIPRCNGTFSDGNDEVRPWSSTIDAFRGDSPSLLQISVKTGDPSAPPQLDWVARRTTFRPAPDEPDLLSGQIRFHRKANGAS